MTARLCVGTTTDTVSGVTVGSPPPRARVELHPRAVARAVADRARPEPFQDPWLQSTSPPCDAGLPQTKRRAAIQKGGGPARYCSLGAAARWAYPGEV